VTAAIQPSVAARALTGGLTQLVRRGLRGVWVRGELPPAGVVWAANHHSWWDGFVAGSVLREQHRSAVLLMDGDNLRAFGFLRSVGVISAQRPREALQQLRQGRVLVIFPEGQLRPLGPLGPVARGAEWLARTAPAPVVPVAVRVIGRGHQYPEALVDIGARVAPEDIGPVLADRVHQLDVIVRGSDPRRPVAGFRCAVRGRSSWDERISRWAELVRK